MNYHLLNIEQRRAALKKIVLLLAAVPVNVFFFVTINNVNGIFGARDFFSSSGILAVACFSALAVIAIVLLQLRRRSGFFVSSFAFFCISSCFAFAFAFDWLISLIAIVFNCIAGFSALRNGINYEKVSAENTRVTHFHIGAWAQILFWLNFVVIGLAILEAGYHIVKSPAGVVSVLIIAFSVLILSCRQEWKLNRPTIKHGPYFEWLLIPLILFIFIWTRNPRIIIAVIAFRQILVTIRYFTKTPIAKKLNRYLFRRPAQLLGLSFFIVIAIGTIILSFPYASAEMHPIHAIDALFTATSATCVTGLIVLDTPNNFTLFGQSIILLLIQIGGLGIMTISTFAAIIIGRNIGLGQEYSLTRMTGEASVNRVYQLIKFICLFTFFIEIVGMLILFPQFINCGMSWKTSLWKSSFHAISAFCNAGFSLQTNSLVPFQYNPGILYTMSSLIIMGGLGFGVLYWFWEHITFQHRKKSLHVKIILWSSVILLTGMACFVLLFEYNGALNEFSTTDKIANAWFYSVTPRTAGFNTITVNSVAPVTRFITMVLMFIGVAPGSTGGGIKITTVLVLLLTIRTLMRGDKEAQAFGFSLSNGTIYRAAAVLVLGIVTCVTGFILLLGTQSIPADSLAFETVSAFGTVGLSMGNTAQMNFFGKLVVIVLMFIGRVGPLTLVLSMRPLRHQEIFYPKANVMVG